MVAASRGFGCNHGVCGERRYNGVHGQGPQQGRVDDTVRLLHRGINQSKCQYFIHISRQGSFFTVGKRVICKLFFTHIKLFPNPFNRKYQSVFNDIFN